MRLALKLAVATAVLLLIAVPVVLLAQETCDADTCMGGSLSSAKKPADMAVKQFVEAQIKENRVVRVGSAAAWLSVCWLMY